MSLSISGLSAAATPAPSAPDSSAKLTVTQQIHALKASGRSAAEIAAALGLPVSQVNSALNVATTTTTTTTAASATSTSGASSAADGHIDVRA